MSVDTSQLYAEANARRSVRITVTDGAVMEGSLVIPKTRSVAELLNNTRPFVEFESANGERIYIAKPSIRTVQTVDCKKR